MGMGEKRAMGAGTLSREGGGGGWAKDDSEVIEEEARAEELQWRKRALGIGNSSMCRGVREEEGGGVMGRSKSGGSQVVENQVNEEDLVEEYDIHDPNGHCSLVLPFLMETTEVIAIVAVHGIVFALAHSDVCAAFSGGSSTHHTLLGVFWGHVLSSFHGD
ncbi:hypothetical protein U1Q18_037368 [Sarracenia purpurea var. burkii]